MLGRSETFEAIDAVDIDVPLTLIALHCHNLKP